MGQKLGLYDRRHIRLKDLPYSEEAVTMTTVRLAKVITIKIFEKSPNDE